jgi:hypothetical protein
MVGSGAPEMGRKIAVESYADWINRPEQPSLRKRIRRELRGRDLYCFCSLDKPCHADVLLAMANAPEVSRA